MYVEMQRFGLFPNTFSLTSSLKACGRIVYKIGGVSIHAQVHKHGFCNIVYVQTALVDFYSKVGRVEVARKVFDEMLDKNVVSWNSILSGYVKSGDLAMARGVFDKMPEKDVISWNSMISGYGREGNMEQAFTLFHQMPQRNIASWNAVIGGYLDCGNIELARPDQRRPFIYSNQMIQPNVNIQPDKMTFASVISACSQLGDITSGSWVESCMTQLGVQIDDHLATALIDLYAKCGSFDKAYELFHGLQKKDLVSYTAMILGCGLNGRANDAIKLFEEMTDAQIYPNLKLYRLVPSRDHYGIMVDMLGRAGRLKEAYELIKSMPMQPHAGVWGALLLACTIHTNVEIGEIAAKHCFNLEPNISGYQTLLSNIYASVGRWDDAKILRKGLQEKIPGCSWMEQS
ncbi:hypothetical protein Vadar_034239 [Vaccinium darrowii]|uniref:Uncharacterized protein n=1 Tax=Vaccinium darrowii TaxID=229202 RepID=A0ACB7ZFR4_9ERIC|nr:hypothetical protein Vadar_034239 [Vaccinium darrowii]